MKGISVLLAAVLLIAITVAVAILVMGWFSTLARDAQVYNEEWECVEWEHMNTIDCRMKVNLSEPINWDELDKSYEEYQEGLNDDWVCEIIAQSQTCTKEYHIRQMVR